VGGTKAAYAIPWADSSITDDSRHFRDYSQPT